MYPKRKCPSGREAGGPPSDSSFWCLSQGSLTGARLKRHNLSNMYIVYVYRLNLHCIFGWSPNPLPKQAPRMNGNAVIQYNGLGQSFGAAMPLGEMPGIPSSIHAACSYCSDICMPCERLCTNPACRCCQGAPVVCYLVGLIFCRQHVVLIHPGSLYHAASEIRRQRVHSELALAA